MHAVVLGLLAAAVINAAAGDDQNVRIVAYIKIVVNEIVESALRHDDGDMHALVFRAARDGDIYALLVRLGVDGYISRRSAKTRLAVLSYAHCALRYLFEIRDCGEQAFFHIVEFRCH